MTWHLFTEESRLRQTVRSRGRVSLHLFTPTAGVASLLDSKSSSQSRFPSRQGCFQEPQCFYLERKAAPKSPFLHHSHFWAPARASRFSDWFVPPTLAPPSDPSRHWKGEEPLLGPALGQGQCHTFQVPSPFNTDSARVQLSCGRIAFLRGELREVK